MIARMFSSVLLLTTLLIVSCEDQGDPVSVSVPTPVISAVVPDSGKAGDTITVSGSNFGSSRGTSTVQFGSLSGTVYPSWTATSIRVVIPSNAAGGNVSVTVSVGGKTSAASPFKVLALTTVSFAGDVLPLFTGSTYGCTGCHGGQNNLFLGTYAQVMAGNSNNGPVVVAGDTNSVLIQKLKGTASFGSRMPFGSGPMSNADMRTIITWVKEGANNN